MPSVAPTKSNLMAMKKSLALARLGYDLLDRKRTLMLREMSRLTDDVRDIQEKIGIAFTDAYESLRKTNMTLGQNEVLRIAMSRDTDDDLKLLSRSVMGVEIPDIRMTGEISMPNYGFSSTNPLLDETYIAFMKVRDLTAKAAAVENSVYRLAKAIKSSQKRAMALKNVVIPELETSIGIVAGYLEEKEREEFTTLKVIKERSAKKA